MYVLAGASGAGKSTLAEMLASRLGLRLVEVDTSPCLRLSGAVRQLCFLYHVGRVTMIPMPNRIADNSLLTVYGYTAALAARGVVEAARELVALARRLAEAEARVNRVVLVYAPPSRRLGNIREGDIYARDEALHLEAQEHMKRLAAKLGIPIVANTDVIEARNAIEEIIREGRRA